MASWQPGRCWFWVLQVSLDGEWAKSSWRATGIPLERTPIRWLANFSRYTTVHSVLECTIWLYWMCVWATPGCQSPRSQKSLTIQYHCIVCTIYNTTSHEEIQVYGLPNLNNCFCLYWLVSSRSSESLIPARSVRGLMYFGSEQVHNLKVHYPSQAIFMEGDIHCDSFRTWHSRKGLAKASPSARCCHLTAPRGLNKDNLGLETRTHTQMYVLLYILLYLYNM